MNNISVRVPLMRCFGPMIAAIQPLSEEDVASHGLLTSSEIDVVKAEGWAYVEVEANKTKPGWISTTPGSILWMSIDTNFGSLVDPHFITLAVLASYQHMGQAEVSCVSGCMCQKSKIDGHITDQRHSIPKLHSFLVTPRPGSSKITTPLLGSSGKKNITVGSGTTGTKIPTRGSRGIRGIGGLTSDTTAGSSNSTLCVIQLEVLTESGSGEHKVKVLQLAIKTLINVSDSLPHAH